MLDALLMRNKAEACCCNLLLAPMSCCDVQMQAVKGEGGSAAAAALDAVVDSWLSVLGGSSEKLEAVTRQVQWLSIVA